MHPARLVRDVNADRAADAVSIPCLNFAGGVPFGNEAIVITSVASALATAEARDVVQDLRMTRGKEVGRANDLDRARTEVQAVGQQRKIGR